MVKKKKMLTLTENKPRVFIVDLKDIFKEFYLNEKINWIFDRLSLKDIISNLDNSENNINTLFLSDANFSFFSSRELDVLMFHEYLSTRLDLILLLNTPFVRSYEKLKVDGWLGDTTIIYVDK